MADLTAKKQGGMFSIHDVPYQGSSETWVECVDVTSGKKPVVGIEGWTKLPGNDYKATMNAVAKVCQFFRLGIKFGTLLFCDYKINMFLTLISFLGRARGHCRKRRELGILREGCV